MGFLLQARCIIPFASDHSVLPGNLPNTTVRVFRFEVISQKAETAFQVFVFGIHLRFQKARSAGNTVMRFPIYDCRRDATRSFIIDPTMQLT